MASRWQLPPDAVVTPAVVVGTGALDVNLRPRWEHHAVVRNTWRPAGRPVRAPSGTGR